MTTRPVSTPATPVVKAAGLPTAKPKLVSTRTSAPSAAYDSVASAAAADLASLITLVMMRATKAEEEQLRSLLDQIRAKAKQREEVRQKIGDTQQRAALDIDGAVELTSALFAQQFDSEVSKLRDDLDKMSEMGEMESLRLQLAMDRMSKMMTTLSNILKKMSDTSSSIIQNLK